MFRKLTLLFIMIALVLAFPLAISTAQDDADIIRYPITVEPELLNPFLSDTIAAGTVIRNIYEGLIAYDTRTGEFQPRLAESWEVSDDLTQFTFNLREGVQYHQIEGVEYGEGEREVTADDIVWNYKLALLGDEDVSILASGLDFIVGAEEYTAASEEAGDEFDMDSMDVEGLQALDDYTVQITLVQPDRLFLVNGMISITSPVAYAQLGDDFIDTPVGTGPYQFVEWLRQDRLVLEANPDYYIDGLPANDGIRFISYGDANTALLDYREDNIDFLFAFPSGQRSAIIEEFGDQFSEREGLHVRYWGFNMEDGYLADKPLVRQAMSHALDRVTSWDILAEGARFPATLGFLPPSMPASTPSSIYDFDLERAAELLEEAGYPGGEGLEPINIYLLEVISDEAQVVVWQQALEELGFEINFVVEDGATYWDNIVTDAADVFQNGWAAGLVDPSDVFDFLILDGNGSMRYDNPEVNELLNQARAELDPVAREALYQQVHDIVMGDAVVIPSAYSKVSWLQKPWIDGFVPGGGGTHTAPLWEVVISE